MSRVWPFEVLVPDLPAGSPAVVYAEIWPSIVPFSHERAAARRASGPSGSPSGENRPHDRLDMVCRAAVPTTARREEGWVLGVLPPGSDQRFIRPKPATHTVSAWSPDRRRRRCYQAKQPAQRGDRPAYAGAASIRGAGAHGSCPAMTNGSTPSRDAVSTITEGRSRRFLGDVVVRRSATGFCRRDDPFHLEACVAACERFGDEGVQPMMGSDDARDMKAIVLVDAAPVRETRPGSRRLADRVDRARRYARRISIF